MFLNALLSAHTCERQFYFPDRLVYGGSSSSTADATVPKSSQRTKHAHEHSLLFLEPSNCSRCRASATHHEVEPRAFRWAGWCRFRKLSWCPSLLVVAAFLGNRRKEKVCSNVSRWCQAADTPTPCRERRGRVMVFSTDWWLKRAVKFVLKRYLGRVLRNEARPQPPMLWMSTKKPFSAASSQRCFSNDAARGYQ